MANFYFQPNLSTSPSSQYKGFLNDRQYGMNLLNSLSVVAQVYDGDIRAINETAKTKGSNDPKGKRAREMYQAAQIVAGSLIDGLKANLKLLETIKHELSENKSTLLNKYYTVFDQRLALPIDQNRVATMLRDDLTILLGIPDPDDERIISVTRCFNAYQNATVANGGFQTALYEIENALSKPEGEKDFLLLYRLGMIHLYSPEHLDLPRALFCFSQVVKVLEGEITGSFKRILCALADYGSEGMMLSQEELLKEVTAKALYEAGMASYIDQNFTEAKKYFSKAWNSVKSPSAGYMLAKSTLFIGGETSNSDTVKILSEVIETDSNFAFRLSVDEELYHKSLMLPILNNLRDNALSEVETAIANSRKTMSPESQAIPILKEVEKKLGLKSYFEVLEASNELKKGRNWKILPTSFDHKYSINGHTLKVNSTVFSPDSQFIASASWKVLITGAKSGEELQTLMGHSVKEYVYSLAFSTNSVMLASASTDRTIKLWNAKTGQELFTLIGHKQSINNVAFSPNGNQLASGSVDASIILWNSSTGELLDRLKGHKDSVNYVTYAPNGKLLASCSDDKTIIIWDVETKEKIRQIEGHNHVIESITFSPDSKKLVSAGWDKIVRLWNVETGEKIREMKGHITGVSDVAFNHDGQTISSISYNRRTQISVIKLWDTETGVELQSFAGNFYHVTFSPDGNTLALSTSEKDIKVFAARPTSVLDFIPLERSIREQIEKLKEAEEKEDAIEGNNSRKTDAVWIGEGDRRRGRY
ncbi:MAG: WD40 repeat domain-containing protein [Chloroherpetonaceae bacterium]|nr:WD40 repeat domain-containing protein [Chloroherpetonaceae bacterium]